MKKYRPLLIEKTMEEWHDESSYRVFDTRHWKSIEGSNNRKLSYTGSYGSVANFNLSIDKIHVDNPNENEYSQNEDYFYYKVSSNPTIYSFVSTSVGGAIRFLGKGRWSGDSSSFGESIGEELAEAYINSSGGFAIPVKELIKEVKKNFPGLEFKVEKKYKRISVDFSKYDTEDY